MGEQLVSRDFLDEDAEQIKKIHSSIWGFEVPLEYWHWKYRDPPDGSKGMVVTTKDERIISFCGFWRREIYLQGEYHPILTICDVMSNPEYKGRSAFTILLNRIENEVIYNQFVFGFSNKISHYIFAKHFWKINLIDSSIPVHSVLLNPAAFVKGLKLFKGPAEALSRMLYKGYLAVGKPRGLTIEPVDEVSHDFDLFWQKVIKGYDFILKRDRAYLDWRYMKDPLLTYRFLKAMDGDMLVGWMVSTITRKKGKNVGQILDWLVPHNQPDVFKEMLRSTVSAMLTDKADQMDIWLMPEETAWISSLKRYFHVQRKKRSFLFGCGPIWFEGDYTTKRENIRDLTKYFNLGDSDFLGR